MPKKPPTAIWQVKEAEKLNQTSSRLASLALNTATSDADFYRAAVFEAVNIDRRRRAREARARAAGQRVEGDPVDPNENPNKRSGGIEVLNKDNIDPQTAKRLGQTQLDHIFHLCKRHKHLVDTATKSIDTKLHKRWEERLTSTKLKKRRQAIKRRRKKQAALDAENASMSALNGGSSIQSNISHSSSKSSTSSKTSKQSKKNTTSNSRHLKQLLPLPTQYVRDELPNLDFPLTLKNYNSKRTVEGWKYDANKLKKLVNTAVSSLDMTEPQSRVRHHEDIERKRKIAILNGNDPDDVRPGEYGLSFAQKKHWRMHLEQLNSLVEDAPLRIDSKIDKHVRRVWSLNRQRGKKDVDKTKGMKNDFPLTLKRDASREQLLGWDGALTLLGEICETATAKIDNDWGTYGPPRSIRGSGHVKIPNASIASRHGEKGCIDLYGRSNSSDSIRSSLAVPKLSSDRPKKLIGKELRQALKKKLGKNQLSVAYVDGIKNVEGLGLSMQYFLGGRDVIKKMTELDVANRKRNGGR